MERASGILLHISSLPSPYGIGTLGKAAYEFGDFLVKAGQRYWQMLPLGQTSIGDSPYQSFSAFAGNPYFIDLTLLCEDGLLLLEECDGLFWGDKPGLVDYAAIYAHRQAVLQKAYHRGFHRDAAEVAAFVERNRDWLPDYALFMALKAHFGMRAWTEWEDEDIRLRKPAAVAAFTALLKEEINYHIYVQYLFFKQWAALKAYLAAKGVRLIGDLPIYVALDSADVWAEPENYDLDENREPLWVAGVPPDYFSATGQLWGNPLYDWAHMEQSGYAWWIRRLDAAARLFDMIRIDHFRGLQSYWRVPYGETTARNGEWVNGPGMKLIRVLQGWFPNLALIAEDLGYLTPDVLALLKESGYPGMKVLQFAFDSREPSDYLPHNYPRHCVCYTGTHDNTTAAGWFTEAAAADIEYATAYLGLNQEEGLNWGLIRGGMGSVADLFVAQMQDYLNLGNEARMNTPSTLGQNWQWRLLSGELTDALAAKLAAMTRMYGR